MVIAATPPAWSTSPPLKGRPLRDARRHVRGGGDLRRASRRASTDGRGFELRRRSEDSRDREGPLRSRATCASRSRKGFLRRRSDRQRRWRSPRAASRAAAGATNDDAEHAGAASSDPARRLPKADGKHTFDKLLGLPPPATRPATTPPTTSGSRPRSRARSPQTWVSMCPAPGLRGPRRRGSRASGNEDRGSVNCTSNCVQCGAITAKGGRLTPPEGGDGPNYQDTQPARSLLSCSGSAATP